MLRYNKAVLYGPGTLTTLLRILFHLSRAYVYQRLGVSVRCDCVRKTFSYNILPDIFRISCIIGSGDYWDNSEQVMVILNISWPCTDASVWDWNQGYIEVRYVNLLYTSKTSYMFWPTFVAIFRKVLYEGHGYRNNETRLPAEAGDFILGRTQGTNLVKRTTYPTWGIDM
jgi:hypothetical protein